MTSIFAVPIALVGFLTSSHLSTGRVDDADQAIALAQTQLQQKDFAAATRTLESALVTAAEPQRAGLVTTLCEAYRAAASDAQQRGATVEADEYRVSLQILETATKAVRTPEQQNSPPAKLATPPIEPAKQSPNRSPLPPANAPDLFNEEMPPTESVSPKTPPANAARNRTPETPDTVCARADTLFRQRQYPDASKLYEELSRRNELPASRVSAWAYCRRSVVYQRIQASPTDKAEWQGIFREIDAIHKLSPHWFDEYLRSLASEKSAPPKNSVRRAAATPARTR